MTDRDQLREALAVLIDVFKNPHGTLTPDYGEICGDGFQMMTMHPDPVAVANALSRLPDILAALATPDQAAATITELRQRVAELEETVLDQGRASAQALKDYATMKKEAVLAEREACAKVCEEQIKIFLSPKYAARQPMSPFGERFACGKCAQEIRNRSNDHEG